MSTNLFRAKRFDDGKWVKGYYLHYRAFSPSTRYIEQHTILPLKDDGLLDSLSI